MSGLDRVHRLVGPYAAIAGTLLSHPADWTPPPRDSKEAMVIKLPTYEYSLEGPAGTGKTFFEGTLLEELHKKYPNIRTLVVRKTRVSLSESFLQVFEDDVLKGQLPKSFGTVSREGRKKYVWPNGSETILGGMDKPTRIFSTQYDVIFVVEAIEFTEDEYQSLYRALRNQQVPFQAMITDTNPGAQTHFLNKKPEREGTRMKRILTRHRHNPRYYNPKLMQWTGEGRQYIENLHQLTGVMRKRLLEGKWCAATGVIYPNYDPDIHIIKPDQVPELEYYIGGVDFGYNDSLVMQVWGVSKERNAYRVWERYGRHVTIERATDWLIEAGTKYELSRFVADHKPEMIRYMNENSGPRGGRRGVRVKVSRVRKGPDSIQAGIALTRDCLGDPVYGKSPRAFFVEGALQEVDRALEADDMPYCTEMEIPGYVYAERKDGEGDKEIPDPGCVDHGCDAMSYCLRTIYETDFANTLKAERHETVVPSVYSKQIQDMSPERFDQWVKEQNF